MSFDNYKKNFEIEKLVEQIDFFDLEVFQKIVKIFLEKNCDKKSISQQKIYDLIEKIEKI